MGNTYFSSDSPEEYEENYQKWLKLTATEIRTVSAAKSRIYVSVADMDLIQEAFELLVESKLCNPEVKEDKDKLRRVMGLGLSLEDIKIKLKRRMEREAH